MRTAFVLSLAGFVSALAIAPVKADDIVIAVAGPMTGPVAAIGEQMKRGAETAAAAINEAGGIAGRNVKIVVEDDVCDPKQAVAVANLIVGQQIKFVDGHACSGSSIPASDVYNDNKVLMMSPASSNPALTEKGYPTIMRLYARDDAQGAFAAPYIIDNFKGKPVAILHDKSAYGKGLATVVKQTLNAAGLNEVLFDGINPGEKDYSAIVSKLKSLNVAFIYFGGYHTEAGLILRQAADQGYKPQMMTGDALATADFWPIAGPAGEGTLFTFPSDPRKLAHRRQGDGAVQGAGLQSGRLHAVLLRRRPGDRRRHQARRLGRSGQGRPGAGERQADRNRARPDRLRLEGRHREAAVRHEPVEQRQVRRDQSVGDSGSKSCGRVGREARRGRFRFRTARTNASTATPCRTRR